MPTPTEISKAIAAIERTYPPDDLITTYKDFLKVRHVLPYYSYNPKVLVSLVDLACSLWYSKARVNRLLLVSVIKQYGSKVKAVKDYYGRSKAELHPFPVEVNKKICWLFQRTFDIELPVNRTQAETIKVLCNSVLINAALGAGEEQWLCSNIEKSYMLLNRVLRYPVASKVISQWAKANYLNNAYRDRRAEMAGWLLDEDPDFIVDEQTLADDFEYLNKKDREAIRHYNEELQANTIIENELSEVLNPQQDQDPETIEWELRFDPLDRHRDYVVSPPQLQLTKRFYPVPIDPLSYRQYNMDLPDFESLTKEFYDNISYMQNTTMLWAITYSRLDMPCKTALLKKHYSEATSNSFFYICRRLQSVELLQWLSRQ
ncbi:hypothetical protein [Agriterribacter sp.]|uniref:hypothetical protein n=1 Tax=Agriterribacter sp. TaxID=2821509 RepID=UPI002B626D40|nr:hypothetical protein [Agriterribacter sp.]HRO46188.1 hypothetical protein [Agriterribacter sp.]HRQ16302.1 hypothetical protein [Agriterribacter sp.]